MGWTNLSANLDHLTWAPPDPGRFVVSVDLGQSIDPTAICVLEITTRRAAADARYHDPPGPQVPEDWYGPSGGLKHPNRVHRLDVRHLERLPLRMPYPEQVEYIQKLLRREPLTLGTPLILDQTGVGRPVVDLFRRAPGLDPIAVTITAGDGESKGDHYNDYRVAKSRLVSHVQSVFHGGELRISEALEETEVLIRELQDFRATVSDTGHWRFGARSGMHDDLVLALALGVWWACRERHATLITTFRV
jgi:hypothetical protein